MGIFDRFKKKSTSEDGESPGQLETESAAERPDEPQGESEIGASEQAEFEHASPSAGLPDDEESGGIFSRFRQGLQKTTQLLRTDIRDLFKQEGQLVDDAFLDGLFEILVRTDMGAGPANAIREEIQSEFRGRVVEMGDVLRSVKKKLLELIEQEEHPVELQPSGPTVILVVGVNGSGKTTSIAKLTRLFRDQGKSVLLGAGDTFRAAAVEQLTVWAERLGAEIVTGKQGADPASVVHRTVATAIEKKIDVCIVDTAGRLQTQTNLMDQLAKNTPCDFQASGNGAA